MNNRLLSAISLCRKAGKLVLGFDPMKEAAQKGQIKLLLLCADLSPKTHKEVLRVVEAYHVPWQEIPYTMDEMHPYLGKRAGVLAVCDTGFAGMVAKLLPNQLKEDTIL